MTKLSVPGVEQIEPIDTPLPLAHALFDFDGTLSLLREGWQQIMAPMMVGFLHESDPGADASLLSQLVREYIGESTGRQTIFQMMWLAEQVAARGGEAMDPLAYKKEYLARLDAHIAARISDLNSGLEPADTFLMPGSVEALEHLTSRGLVCYVASGTDVGYVSQEAVSLGLGAYLTGGVYGALDNWRDFSKARVIQDILSKNKICGSSLVTFGDGYVEIENTRSAHGLAVGIASNESAPGEVDLWKRERLVRAGAKFILADLKPVPQLIDALTV